VKRAGLCHEYLQISALGDGAEARGGRAAVGGNAVDGRIYFRDCGSLGKQTLSIDASEVMVRFKTGQASLAQRGFLLYFEGAATTLSIISTKHPVNILADQNYITAVIYLQF